MFLGLFGAPGAIRTHGVSLRSGLMSGIMFAKHTGFMNVRRFFVHQKESIYSLISIIRAL